MPTEPSRTPVGIVEDDATIRTILAEWIGQSEAFQCVVQCGDGASALENLPAVRPEVVLMDINLPGLPGIECVRRLKPILPATQFIMITVYGDADHIFEALAAGASGYLLKRVMREELLAALQELQRGGSPMTSSIARKVVQHFQHAPPPANESDRLSPREHDVLQLLASGYANKEIADRLGLSCPTVATYIRRIYEKLQVHTRAAAVGKFSVLRHPPTMRT
ncbi:MAG: response regulator transcription factor [Rhodocyclaceae bacterium]|nr:response regulator transcription factor [Rhodocyclaceae bacterium]